MQPLISEVPFQSTGVFLELLAQKHPPLRDLPERSKMGKAPRGARGPEMASISTLLFAAHLRETLHFQSQLKGYGAEEGRTVQSRRKSPHLLNVVSQTGRDGKGGSYE